MWLCVTIAYVIPAAVITTKLLSARAEDLPSARNHLPAVM
jgi:hypothetical protein